MVVFMWDEVFVLFYWFSNGQQGDNHHACFISDYSECYRPVTCRCFCCDTWYLLWPSFSLFTILSLTLSSLPIPSSPFPVRQTLSMPIWGCAGCLWSESPAWGRSTQLLTSPREPFSTSSSCSRHGGTALAAVADSTDSRMIHRPLPLNRFSNQEHLTVGSQRQLDFRWRCLATHLKGLLISGIKKVFF